MICLSYQKNIFTVLKITLITVYLRVVYADIHFDRNILFTSQNKSGLTDYQFYIQLPFLKKHGTIILKHRSK